MVGFCTVFKKAMFLAIYIEYPDLILSRVGGSNAILQISEAQSLLRSSKGFYIIQSIQDAIRVYKLKAILPNFVSKFINSLSCHTL